VAVVLLWGYRLIPAIFAGAFAANILTAGSLVTCAAIAAWQQLEALIIAGMVARWSNGSRYLRTAAWGGEVSR
jgi:hypothetical protein